MGNDRSNFWQNWWGFFEDIKKRLQEPFGQPAFVFYFFGIIVIVGGFGVLISLTKLSGGEVSAEDKLAVARALSTYLLAILAAAFVEINLADSLRSVRMFALFVLVVGAVLAVVSQISLAPGKAVPSATVGTGLALFLWWIANSENERLFEPPPSAEVATGGEIGEPSGDLSDIQH